MSKTESTLAIVSQMISSAKKRPGHMLHDEQVRWREGRVYAEHTVFRNQRESSMGQPGSDQGQQGESFPSLRSVQGRNDRAQDSSVHLASFVYEKKNDVKNSPKHYKETTDLTFPTIIDPAGIVQPSYTSSSILR